MMVLQMEELGHAPVTEEAMDGKATARIELFYIFHYRLCQQRWLAFSGMVTFRNAVSGAVTNFVSGNSQQIAFGRGSLLCLFEYKNNN